MSADIHKVFAVLHKALADAENSVTTTHLFGDLTGPECVMAHNILKPLDDALKHQWVKHGSPDDDRLAL